MSEIKKCWCTYGTYYSTGYGKIIKEIPGNPGSVVILYSEKQIYPAEYWEDRPQYIQRFDTLEESAKQYQYDINNYTDMRMDHPISDEQLKEDMRYKFPSYFKEKDYNITKNLQFTLRSNEQEVIVLNQKEST